MRKCLLGLLLLGFVAGCRTNPPSPDPNAGIGLPPEASPASPELAGTVNGADISLQDVYDLLLESYGHACFQQLVASAAVDQAAKREGVTVTEAEIRAENALTLQQLMPNLDPAREESLLVELLSRKAIPRPHWDLTMRRNALLRKMAARRLKITDEMLTAEFNRQYGLKVQIRHIQSASVGDAQKIMDRLEKGEDFSKLAMELSTNTRTAPLGGKLAPFSRDSALVPADLRRAAFTMAEGKTSQIIKLEKDYHILKLDKTFPPKDVTFQSVKDELRRKLIVSRLRPMQTKILQDLIGNADLQVINPVLKFQVRAAEAVKTP